MMPIYTPETLLQDLQDRANIAWACAGNQLYTHGLFFLEDGKQFALEQRVLAMQRGSVRAGDYLAVYEQFDKTIKSYGRLFNLLRRGMEVWPMSWG